MRKLFRFGLETHTGVESQGEWYEAGNLHIDASVLSMHTKGKLS